jgi:hypothetical protein
MHRTPGIQVGWQTDFKNSRFFRLTVEMAFLSMDDEATQSTPRSIPQIRRKKYPMYVLARIARCEYCFYNAKRD